MESYYGCLIVLHNSNEDCYRFSSQKRSNQMDKIVSNMCRIILKSATRTPYLCITKSRYVYSC